MEAVRKNLPPNPKETANPLSQALFVWTIDLFKKGYSKVLDVSDLFQPLQEDKSELLGDRLDLKWEDQRKKKKPSLIKAMFFTFWREIIALAAYSVFNELLIRMVQPMILGKLLIFFSLGADKTDTSGYYYGAAMIMLTAISSLTFNHFTLTAFHAGMKYRVAVCSVIYRKALRLSRTALGQTAPGKVVNLLSNDVGRFDMVSIFLNMMWIAPILTIIVGILLYIEIQWAGLVGIAVVFIVVPIQSYTGKLSSIFRYQTALRTDERVRFMDEIISGVQVIKMYAWEIPFSKLISEARKSELRIVMKNTYVRALYMTFNLFTTRAALFCTILTMALTDKNITADKIFVIASYYQIIAQTLSQMFVRGVAEIAETSVAFRRLQKFLEYEEKDEAASRAAQSKFLKDFGLDGIENDEVGKKNLKNLNSIPSDIALSVKNATARWIPLVNKAPRKLMSNKKGESKRIAEPESFGDDDWAPPILDNINLEVKKGLLVGIIGSVGSGKSSFLQAILEELPLESGSIKNDGKVSYASQEPWVFAGTVRQNILFGQPMDKSRYSATVKSCALLKDFDQFADGDKTKIGERGASLSGGQRARINLARAVYRKADLYLFDDPLSAVDAHVGKHLFDQVIGPNSRLASRSTTRILVTHQVHFLKQADWILIFSEGKIQAQGSPNDLAKKGIDLAGLQTEEDENDPEQETKSISSSTQKRSRTQSVTSSVHSLDVDTLVNNEAAEEPEELRNLEKSSKGVVKGSIFWNYIRAGGPLLFGATIMMLFLITQSLVSAADWWVSFWTKQEELRTFYTKNNTADDVLVVGEGDKPLLRQLEDWYQGQSSIYILSTDLCIIIHGTIIVAIFVFGIIRSIGFFRLAIRASQKLHDSMFSGVIMTPMRFFDTNPSGRILNRFSKDMGATDEFLPKAMLDTAQIMLAMIGSIIVTCSVEPYFLLVVAGLGVVFWIVRKVYLRTSKNIKRLEGITRSPVFTHLSASLAGLSTIRAFDAQDELIKEFDAHQDLHSAAWYMFIATATAFGLSLDILCLVFTAVVIFYFLVFSAMSTGDQVGLAITQSMALTGLLQWGVRQSAEVANQLTSVERILEYRDLDRQKEPEKDLIADNSWPNKGEVEFRHISFKYFETASPVLKDLSFVIKPKEKVGIVGRTGAGKSSLIGAIFRLAIVEGELLIDGVDTSMITLQKLRSNISIIPQDPVLFSGTIRRNLDPFEEYPDADIWRALEAVELKDVASGSLGLQSPVMSSGSNFSVGQRQLVCLARAIIRNNRILVLDEATANVDPITDGLIQRTIREQFARCTVLTIAHRLHTIIDSDRVLVMDAGQVEEFDTPYNLLQMPLGIFRDMVLTTGPQESERLMVLAKQQRDSIRKHL